MSKKEAEQSLQLEVIYGNKELCEPQMLSKIIDLLLECEASSKKEK